jgi:hypothetical protein
LKAAVDIETQTQQTVHFEVLTANGQTLEDSIGHSDIETTEVTYNTHTTINQYLKISGDTQ